MGEFSEEFIYPDETETFNRKGKSKMSEKNDAIKFLANVPITVRFSYDTPKTGEKDGRPWFLWGVEKDGVKVSFFATPYLNDMLLAIPVKKGMVATISQNQDPEDKKKIFWLVKVGDQEYDSRNMKFEKATASPAPVTSAPPAPFVDVKPENVVNTYWRFWDLMQAESEKRGEKGLPVALLREAVTSCMMEYSKKGGKLLGTVTLWTDDLKEKAKRFQSFAQEFEGGWIRISSECGLAGVKFAEIKPDDFLMVWRKFEKQVEAFEAIGF